jgi:hypothetical protein
LCLAPGVGDRWERVFLRVCSIVSEILFAIKIHLKNYQNSLSLENQIGFFYQFGLSLIYQNDY